MKCDGGIWFGPHSLRVAVWGFAVCCMVYGLGFGFNGWTSEVTKERIGRFLLCPLWGMGINWTGAPEVTWEFGCESCLCGLTKFH